MVGIHAKWRPPGQKALTRRRRQRRLQRLPEGQQQPQAQIASSISNPPEVSRRSTHHASHTILARTEGTGARASAILTPPSERIAISSADAHWYRPTLLELEKMQRRTKNDPRAEAQIARGSRDIGRWLENYNKTKIKAEEGRASDQQQQQMGGNNMQRVNGQMMTGNTMRTQAIPQNMRTQVSGQIMSGNTVNIQAMPQVQQRQQRQIGHPHRIVQMNINHSVLFAMLIQESAAKYGGREQIPADVIEQLKQYSIHQTKQILMDSILSRRVQPEQLQMIEQQQQEAAMKKISDNAGDPDVGVVAPVPKISPRREQTQQRDHQQYPQKQWQKTYQVPHTISKDYTAGEKALQANLLANLGRRGKTSVNQ